VLPLVAVVARPPVKEALAPPLTGPACLQVSAGTPPPQVTLCPPAVTVRLAGLTARAASASRTA
jgi:hypothetical protein